VSGTNAAAVGYPWSAKRITTSSVAGRSQQASGDPGQRGYYPTAGHYPERMMPTLPSSMLLRRVAEGVAERGPRGDAEFGEDLVEVGRDRPRGEEEAGGDLLVGVARRREQGDLALLRVREARPVSALETVIPVARSSRFARAAQGVAPSRGPARCSSLPDLCSRCRLLRPGFGPGLDRDMTGMLEGRPRGPIASNDVVSGQRLS
jgi:hypothetical protein